MKDTLMPDDYYSASPWINMSHIDWSCITDGCPTKFYKKGEFIYQQQDIPDTVYLVKNGRVCLNIYGRDGEIRSLFIAESGTFFGELSPIDNLPNVCSASAVSDTILYIISKARFLEELNTNHTFSLNILSVMTCKIRLLATILKQHSFNDSTYRVYYALYSLVRQYGLQNMDGTYKLNIKFTHQEMAHLTGLSRVSVSNILLDLTADGIIEKQEGYLIIKNIDFLKSFI